MRRFATTANGQALPEAEVPRLSPAQLRRAVVEVCRGGARLVALFGRRLEAGGHRLHAVLADDLEGRLALASADLAEPRYEALTPDLPEAHAFEREIAEELGIEPAGHPWLKPLRSERGHPFFRVEGDGVHEVGVGPVHAGIIEPGHFRLQCAGEEVLHLEIQLGYQRRGAEALLERALAAPSARGAARAALVAETISGDASIAHATAHALALEGLAGIEAPPRAQIVRAFALELERLANHAGDLGGISADIGYLPGAAYFGRLRGSFLNLAEAISGSRFGRGLVRPGGVARDLDAALVEGAAARLAVAREEWRRLAALFFDAPSVVARLERVGRVPLALAAELGLVGPPARAAGLDRDARRDHPAGAYRFAHLPVALGETGDVHARALVRRLEGDRSLAFVEAEVARLPAGPARRPLPPLAPRSIAVALVEGWRGETVHAVVTGERGEVLRVKVVDPSFHNWFGLAMAMRGEQISDFPLCNKSFNLSYAGHDL